MDILIFQEFGYSFFNQFPPLGISIWIDFHFLGQIIEKKIEFIDDTRYIFFRIWIPLNFLLLILIFNRYLFLEMNIVMEFLFEILKCDWIFILENVFFNEYPI